MRVRTNPEALHLIILYGGELFTGNTMLLAIGWYNGVVSKFI